MTDSPLLPRGSPLTPVMEFTDSGRRAWLAYVEATPPVRRWHFLSETVLPGRRVRFDSVITAPHRYRRWLVTVAGGALAAGAAGLVGAGPFIILLSVPLAGHDRCAPVLSAALWSLARD